MEDTEIIVSGYVAAQNLRYIHENQSRGTWEDDGNKKSFFRFDKKTTSKGIR